MSRPLVIDGHMRYERSHRLRGVHTPQPRSRCRGPGAVSSRCLLAARRRSGAFGLEIEREFMRQLSGTIEELVSIILEEIQTRDRGYQPAVVSAALLLEVAMVSGLVAHADWLLPRGSAAWSADEMLDHLTAFTLFGARQRGGSPALEPMSAEGGR